MKKLTEHRDTFRPMSFEWAYEAWLKHEQSHWLHSEVPMSEDVQDFKKRLTQPERDFVTKIMRFFVTGDMDIGSAYHDHYIPVFKAPEVKMMLSGFAAREALHVAAYSHLIESLGLPESTYNEFLQYGEMVAKHDYMQRLDEYPMAEKLAIISAFGEGMMLFSSFIMLLNFARHGKLKGLGQIVTWSIVDETQHAESMIKVYRQHVREHAGETTTKRIKEIANEMVELEDRFIDLAFGMYDVEGLTKEEVKQYVRYIADRRLISMGMKGVYKVKTNPLPWVESMLGVSQTNFFENRATDYAKGALSGTWADVWAA